MKKIILLIFISLFAYTSFAADVYFSNAGNDVTGNGTLGAPYATISKFNSLTFSAGDHIWWNAGDTFYGAMKMASSGSAGNQITIGAYGTGADPVFTGLSSITGWNNLGGNIWETASTVSTLSACNFLLINGVNTPICRIPNTGYWTVKKGATVGTIIDSTGALVATGLNVVGSQLCLRSIPWMLEVNPVTVQSSSTLTYTGGSSAARQGFGYFLQNDSLFLDSQNEWWYSKTRKKIRIYSTSSPTGIQIPTIDTLVDMNGKNYITFDGIDFEGSNMQMVRINSNINLIVQNCKFQYGERGLGYIQSASSGEKVWSINNTFKNLNNHAMYFGSFSSQDSIYNCTIDSIGMIAGSWFETDQNSGDAVRISGTNSDIRYCTITNISHHGIYMSQSNGLSAQYNLIKYWGMTRYDAGAIYTFNNDTSVAINRRLIDHNIIEFSNQVNAGIAGNNPALWGVYLDGKSRNETISYNTVTGALTGGIHVYDAGYDTIIYNISYNNTQYQYGYVDDNSGTIKYSNFNNMVIKNNQAIAKASSQLTLSYRNDKGIFNNFGISDSSYFARPIDDNLTIATLITSNSTSRTLAGWQTLSSKDIHSSKSPISLSDTTGTMIFIINPSNATINVAVGYAYIDVKGNNNTTGIISVAPWYSYFGIKNGSVVGGVSPSGDIKAFGNKRFR